MKFMNVIWAYAVYFAGNLILYRRDWSELRARRTVTFAGSGRVGSKSVTDKFDREPRETKYIEPKGYIEPRKYAVLKREPIKPELSTVSFDKAPLKPKSEKTKMVVFKGSSRF